MPDPSLRDLQRSFFRALRDRPLDVSDPKDAALYEPLHDEAHDPVMRLFDSIDFSEVQSVQLVAGFRGTGKTTEFSRLEKVLWEADFVVIRVDLDDYLDMNSPVEVSDFLLVLAGAISDVLEDERLLGAGRAKLTEFWDRAKTLLESELTVAPSFRGPGGVSLRVGLKGNPSLRRRIREALQGRLPRLVQEVRAYHDEVLAALRERHGDTTRLVVIIDSLEHLRGTGESVETVRRSVEELFITHGNHIGLPETHMVLSVPPLLALKAERLQAAFVNGAVQAWPAWQVQRRDGSPNEDVVGRLVALVERRGPWRAILPDRGALEQLILASGGYIRDLLNMLIEAIHLAGRGVTQDTADRVVAVVRRGYYPLYADEVQVLRKIALAKDLGAVASTEQTYLERFLDSQLVLCYLDLEFWYDVHPLVRQGVLDAAPAEVP